MRVLVCGSRTFTDSRIIEQVLEGFSIAAWDTPGVYPPTLIHGAAKGADSLAAFAAGSEGWPIEEYPANWNNHGKAAGPIRNQQMIDEGKPDVVYAFVDKPLGESKGTYDMVTRARLTGIPVYVIEVMAPMVPFEQEIRG